MLDESLWNALSESIYQKLQLLTGVKLKLRINNNRSTMLSVRWDKDCTRLSLHRMFLEAPFSVVQELARYIKHGKNKALPIAVKKFIEDGSQRIDYSQNLDKRELDTAGQFFDLQAIYRFVNRTYFEEDLNLSITWYGSPNRRMRSQINFGLYSYPLKLIKIHRLLDSFDIPDYVLNFVVYHEMLHSVCPPFVNKRGWTVVHTPEFKKREREFQFFHEADMWIKNNKNRFFTR